MIKLKLVYLIRMKNAGGYSAWNPIERPMGSLMFGVQTLALDRLEGTREVKDKIKKYNNIKGLTDKYKYDANLMSDNNTTVQPVINIINDMISNAEYSEKKITIRTIAERQDTEDNQ